MKKLNEFVTSKEDKKLFPKKYDDQNLDILNK